MTGEFYDKLSEKGQCCCRQIDKITMNEANGRALEIFTYDVFPSDEISDEVKENMELGAFIKHSDFENEDLTFTANNVPIEQVFTLDHDFVSM